tara:strand:- start:500 stop:637 length:138 start_codon:yes stop_codon:yes gene_type:complete
MSEEMKELKARLEKLERTVAHQNALINKLYTLDTIKNYTEYRKVT